MKRISIVTIAVLVLGGGAFAVAQEPNQLTDQAIAVPPPEKALEAAPVNPLAAEVDKAINATIDRVGRPAVAAEAKPIAEATRSDCLLADNHQSIQVLLTEECVAQVKSTLAEIQSEQPDTNGQAETEDRGDRQRP